MKTLASLLAIGLAGAVLPALPDTLDFSGNICAPNSDGTGAEIACINYAYINQAYGDVAGQVDVTYKDLINAGSSLRWWDTDYNDLQGVAFGGNGDTAGQSWDRIEIAPLAGVSITLNSFDMGAWLNGTLTSNLQIIDPVTNGILLDFGALPIGMGTAGHSSFAPGLTSSDGFAIEWRDSGYNVGIDNINFTVNTSAVPEPVTFLPLSAGLALATALQFRKRTKG